MSCKVLVRGSGDVGSAVAHLLRNRGCQVVIHDTPAPAAPRRGMSFTDAVFDGSCLLEGIEAYLAGDVRQMAASVAERGVVVLFVGELRDAIAGFQPDVLVDARMRKRAVPEPQIDLAPLTIALGPNCEAGATAHAVIETQWGDHLGKVLWSGRTRDLAGEPRTYGGYGRDRFVYAPVAGRFSTGYRIGDEVRPGAVVAQIDMMALEAPLAGILRGLVRHGVPVAEGAKVIEVDPRADLSEVFGIGKRPARIARGVWEAMGSAGP